MRGCDEHHYLTKLEDTMDGEKNALDGNIINSHLVAEGIGYSIAINEK